MKKIWNGLGAAAILLLLLQGTAAADAVVLTTGKTVPGKVVKVTAENVQVRVPGKVVTYKKDDVKRVLLTVLGPGDKATEKEIQLGTSPDSMPFQRETDHYVILTDTSEAACKNAASAMEAMFKAYSELFKPGSTTVKTRIIIYEDGKAMRAYAAEKGVKLTENQPGVFMARNNVWEILTYKRQDDYNTMTILFHEGTHQFITMIMGNHEPPLWVNEGLAVYFETSYWKNDKLHTGIIGKDRLAQVQNAMRTKKDIPLTELFKRQGDTFDSLCYAESWSFVYFMIKSNDGAYAKHFGTYFQMLREGKDADAAFQQTITSDMEKLQQAWKKYVLELKPEKQGK